MKKMFEGISLSLALFDHLEDSVRIMLVIGQCNRTVEEDVIRNTWNLRKWIERVVYARYCLAFRQVEWCFPLY